MQVRKLEKLRATANDHMTMLESNPRRVASNFQDPRVKQPLDTMLITVLIYAIFSNTESLCRSVIS